MEPLTELMIGTTAVIWTTGEAPQPPATIALKWAKDEPKFRSWAVTTGSGPR